MDDFNRDFAYIYAAVAEFKRKKLAIVIYGKEFGFYFITMDKKSYAPHRHGENPIFADLIRRHHII